MCWLIKFKEESTSDAELLILNSSTMLSLGVSDSKVEANLRQLTDHLRSHMARVYVHVVNVASTLQEAAKCMEPDSASLRSQRRSKTARQSLLG